MNNLLNIQKKPRHVFAWLAAFSMLTASVIFSSAFAIDTSNVVVLEGDSKMILSQDIGGSAPDIQPGTQLIYTPVGLEYELEIVQGAELFSGGGLTGPGFGVILIGPGGFAARQLTGGPADLALPIIYKGVPYDTVTISVDGFLHLNPGVEFPPPIGPPPPPFFTTYSGVNAFSAPEVFLETPSRTPMIAGFFESLSVNPPDFDVPKSGRVGGAVHFNISFDFDSLIFTWNKVKVVSLGGEQTVTVQIQTTVSTGEIVITFGDMPNFGSDRNIKDASGNSLGIVGISDGKGDAPYQLIDVSEPDSVPAGTIVANAIYEDFTRARRSVRIDRDEIARAFYESGHDDIYDNLVLFTDFPIDNTVAVSTPVQNTTLGLGLASAFGNVGDVRDGAYARSLHDKSAIFGSDGELEQFISMNHVEIYKDDDVEDLASGVLDVVAEGLTFTEVFLSGNDQLILDDTGPGSPYEHNLFNTLSLQPSDTNDPFFTGNTPFGNALKGLGQRLTTNSAGGLLSHEIIHRWASFPEYLDPDDEDPLQTLLGREQAHWSFFFDTRVPEGQPNTDIALSVMEGSYIMDVEEDVEGEFPLVDACSGFGGLAAFRTNRDQISDGTSALDQYLMGIRTADDTPAFSYIKNPTSPINGVSIFGFKNFITPTDDLAFCGERVELVVADLVALGDAMEADTADRPQTLNINPAHYLAFQERAPKIGDEQDNADTGGSLDLDGLNGDLCNGVDTDHDGVQDIGDPTTAVRQPFSGFSNLAVIGGDNCPGTDNEFQEDREVDLALYNTFAVNTKGWFGMRRGVGIGDACQDDAPDNDSDFDGVPDFRDNCLWTPNPDQVDSLFTGIGDECKEDVIFGADTDGDGILDQNDSCPQTINDMAQESTDWRVVNAFMEAVPGDVCNERFCGFANTNINCVGTSPDADGDGIPDQVDNCPTIPNAGQEDAFGDHVGDACHPFMTTNRYPGDVANDHITKILETHEARKDAICVDVKTTAFILLTEEGQLPSSGSVEFVEKMRQTVDLHANTIATSGRGARGCIAGFSHTGGDEDAKCYDTLGVERSLCDGDMVSTTCIEESTLETRDYLPKFDADLDPDVH